MKHVYAVVFSMLVLCSLSRAQFVADNRVAASAGEDAENPNQPQVCPLGPAPAAPWKKEGDQVFGHIRGSLLVKLKNSSEDIISVFHDSVLTQGNFDPIWHGEYFSAGNGAPQIRFGVTCLFHSGDVPSNFPCDLTVFANDISPLIGSLSVNGQAYVTLKGFTGGSPGFEFDMPARGGDGDTATVHVKAWLVTGDSASLPYTPVTRKEYLDQAQRELQNRKASLVADVKSRIQLRPASEQETVKQQALEQLRNTYSGAELQTRIRIFLNSYKTDEEYMEQHLTAATEKLDRTLTLITDLLTRSTPQQLALPAVVSVPPPDFHGFEDGVPGSTVLVRLRAGYYPAETDQPVIKSLLICWRYRPTDLTSAGIDRQLAMRNPVPVLRKQFRIASMGKAE